MRSWLATVTGTQSMRLRPMVVMLRAGSSEMMSCSAVQAPSTSASTLNFLTRLECDLIKLDRFVIEDILDNEFNKNLVKYSIKLCHSLGYEVCVEGVEEEDVYLFLRDECKADAIQGFYFGRPEPEEIFEKRLIQQ